MKSAIIVPAYSRHNSLDRLLTSINNAEYPSDDIKLIITLDGGATVKVKKIAGDFDFKNGNVEIVTRKKNLGLRKHILWCGEQTKKYGSVIILEDDLFVDKYFYQFANQALKSYREQKEVAGIALYSPRYNEYANLPFEPLYNGYSVYFMQVACSWGQAWTRSQWELFIDWYEDADEDTVLELINLPSTVKNWPETSWKKYFSAYLAETNKYFAYPYQSYTTNYSDGGGVHIPNGSNLHQVPLASNNRPRDKNDFCMLKDSSVCYDPFMESYSTELLNLLELSEGELEVDLYGIKSLEMIKRKKYVLTSRPCNNPINVFELRFRPIEKNISIANKNISGEKIYLAESANIRDCPQSYFKLADYHTYIDFKTKNFAKNYIPQLCKKILQKIFKIKTH